MKRKGMLILGLFLVLLSGFSTLGAAEAMPVKAIIYPLESTIYEDMDALYLLCGLARPSTNRPWSDSQARLILSKIDRNELSPVAAGLYDSILSELDKGLQWKIGDDFQLDAGIVFGLEMYAHSNTADFTTEDDWERSYQERKSLMRVHFDFTSSDFLYTTSDLHYKWSRADYNDTYAQNLADRASADGYIASYKIDATSYYVKKSYAFSQGFFTNFFTNTMNFSFIWPKRAIFSLGGDRWNLSINRDVLSLGNAWFGNLLVDKHHFSDYARFSVFGKNFNYDWILMFLNTTVSDNEQSATTEGRIFMIHTLQFRILDRISMTVSENVMYRYNTFDLGFMNPAFIYHNLNNRSMFNALAYAEVNWAIVPGLEVYAQYALDQARAPHEGESQSDSSGFVAGLRHTSALGNGILTSYAEFAQTTPLLYRRDIVDFVRVNRYWSHSALDESFGGGHVPFFDYIGFPYGGDCRLLEIRTTYRSLYHWQVSAFVRGTDRGAMNLYKPHNESGNNEDDAYYAGKTPSGDIISRNLVCGVEFKADLEKLFSWPGISFEGELDWLSRWDYTKATRQYSDHRSDVQLTLGFSVSV
ncbi:MAG: hypothetical protein J6X41_04660 [Spirochaetales bacterium]|nr:hypothetical protein [Spirochaetales bacterium]